MFLLPAFVVYVAGVALAHPVADVKPDCKNCIRMTKETEAEIEEVIAKIGDFIMDLLRTHHRFHMKYAKFEIGAYSEDQDDVLFQITINDCPDSLPNDEDGKQEQPKSTDKKIETKNTLEQKPSELEPKKVSEKTEDQTILEIEKQNGGSTEQTKPEIMILDLEKLGLDLMNRLEKIKGNTPFVVYVQKSGDQTDQTEKIMFLNRK